MGRQWKGLGMFNPAGARLVEFWEANLDIQGKLSTRLPQSVFPPSRRPVFLGSAAPTLAVTSHSLAGVKPVSNAYSRLNKKSNPSAAFQEEKLRIQQNLTGQDGASREFFTLGALPG